MIENPNTTHAHQVALRPAFSTIYMQLAMGMSQRSTCRRLRVGCVIVTPDNRKVLAVGYNGNASNLVNDCDSETPGACGCLHAEENAVINCDVPRSTKKIVYCTHLPCKMCAKRLVNLGNVQGVWYREDYRLRDCVPIFEHHRISIAQLPVKDPWEEVQTLRQRVKTLESVDIQGEDR